MSSPQRDGPFHRAAPRPGDIVAGKYRVERTIGRGGMGMVVEASHLVLRERVALKFLLPSLAQRDDLVQRFEREGRAAVRIKSEHVARVMDVGRPEGGMPYMVMELLVGRDLGRVLKEQTTLPMAEAVEYIVQACDAIGEAHVLGIVHRDLKPSNLFLTRRADGSPLVKVLDFGISKLMADASRELGSLPGDDGISDASLTNASDVLGSPLYMAPEQIRTPKAVDGRADLWALGAILHKLLTGKAIYAAETPASILAAVVTDPPRRLREELPDAPPELEAVVLRCLEKDPTRRFQTALELSSALLPFLPDNSRAWRRATSSNPNAASFLTTGSMLRPSEISHPSLAQPGFAPQQSWPGGGVSGLSPAPPLPSGAPEPLPAPPLVPSIPTSGNWSTAPPTSSKGRILLVGAAAAALTAGGVLALVLSSASAEPLTKAGRGIATAALLAASRVDRVAIREASAPPPAPSPVASASAEPARPAAPRPASGAVPPRPRGGDDTLDERQ
jgi:serine/threonine protein kinase